MAAGERTLKVTIIGDAKGAEKAFAGVEKAAGGIGKALGVAALVGGVAIAGLGKAMWSFAQAAAEDEQSVAKLRTAVENSGASWDVMRSGMEATIATAQKMAFTDDQARDALSLLTAQTGSAEEAQKRFGLAMDLARGANIDVATASKLLGKVTEENVNVLGRYGLAVTEGTTETELFAMVQERFGGQAEAFAGSTAGKFEVAKIRIQEAKEALGAQLLPVMAILANVLAEKVLPAIEGFVSKLSELSHLFQVGLGGGTIGGEFSDIEKAAFRFGQVMREDIIPAVKDFGAFMRDDVLPVVREMAGAVLPRLRNVLVTIAKFLNEHREIVVAVAAAYAVWKISMLAIMAIQFAQAMMGMVAAFMAMAQAQGIATAAMTLFNLTMLANPIVLVIVAIAALVAAIIIAYKNWDTITAAVKDFADVVRDYVVGAVVAAKDKIVEIFTAMKDAVVGAVVAAKDKLVEIFTAIKDKTIDAVQIILDFVKEYWPEIVTLLSGPFYPLVLLATDAFGIRTALIDAFTATWEAVVGAAVAAKDKLVEIFTAMKNAVIEAAGAIKDKTIDAVQAILDFVTQYWPEIVTLFSGPFLPLVLLATDAFGIRTALIDAFSATWDAVKAGTQAALDAIVGMLQAAPGAFLAAATALGAAIKQGFIAGVQGIAEKLGDVLRGAGDVARAIADSVKRAINTIIDQINRLLKFSFTIPVPGLPDITVHVNPPPIPHLAAGRRNFGGGLALVGEQGPELVALPRGSDVYSAGESRRMAGGGAVINLTVNVSQPLGSPQAIGEAIMRAVVDLQRSGRLSQITR